MTADEAMKESIRLVTLEQQRDEARAIAVQMTKEVHYLQAELKRLREENERLRRALCDVCNERPGVRTVWTCGLETWACGKCLGDDEDSSSGEGAAPLDGAM